MLICSVGTHNIRFRQMLGQFLTSVHIVFYNFNPYAAFKKLFRKIKRYSSAADYNCGFNLCVYNTYLTHKFRNISVRCGYVKFISAFDNKITVRNIHLITALHRTYKKFYLKLFVYLKNSFSAKCIIRTDVKFNKFNSAFCESFCFDCGRKTKYSRYFASSCVFGIYYKIYSESVTHKIKLFKIFSVSHSCNTSVRTEFFSHNGAKCVKFVIFRNGNKYVRLVSLRLAQSFKVSTAPAYAPYIIIILNSVADFTFNINKNYVVALIIKILYKLSADLTAAYYDDIHFSSLFSRVISNNTASLAFLPLYKIL